MDFQELATASRSPEFIRICQQDAELVPSLCQIVSDPKVLVQQKGIEHLFTCLINISGDENVATKMADTEIITSLLKIMNPEIKSYKIFELCSMVLANLTQQKKCIEAALSKDNGNWDRLNSVARIFFSEQPTIPPHNLPASPNVDQLNQRKAEVEAAVHRIKRRAALKWFGSVFTNVTSTPEGRSLVAGSDCSHFSQVLPAIHEDDAIHRSAAVLTLRNLLFNRTEHDDLLVHANAAEAIVYQLSGTKPAPKPSDDGSQQQQPVTASPPKSAESEAPIRSALADCLLLLSRSDVGKGQLGTEQIRDVVKTLIEKEVEGSDIQRVLEETKKVIDKKIEEDKIVRVPTGDGGFIELTSERPADYHSDDEEEKMSGDTVEEKKEDSDDEMPPALIPAK